MLLRIGRFNFAAGRCPGQKWPAAMRNGDRGLTFWLPGVAFDVWMERA